MIFVTVGTHEQPFDRLVEKIDSLKGDGLIDEDVFIQYGYGKYEPKHCQGSRLISGVKMAEYVEKARIVITHGGPSSFIAVVKQGKVPIVVPRKKAFNEHVNDHQLIFCKEAKDSGVPMIIVEDVDTLNDVLANYDSLAGECPAFVSNTQKFNQDLISLTKGLFDED